jgi:hypothetical protein
VNDSGTYELAGGVGVLAALMHASTSASQETSLKSS